MEKWIERSCLSPMESCRHVHLGKHLEDEFRTMTARLRGGNMIWARSGKHCSGQWDKGECLAWSDMSMKPFAEREQGHSTGWYPGTGQHNHAQGSEGWSQPGWTDWQKNSQGLSCLFDPFYHLLFPPTILRGSTCVLSSPKAGMVSPQVWTWRSWDLWVTG